MASTIRGNDNFDTVGSSNTSARLAKAWVNFNGSNTVAINGSYGVSSVTDNATGRYTVNFSTAFANTNYCAAGVARYTNTSWSWASLGMASNDTKTTTAMKFGTTLVSNYFLDSPEVGLTFFGS